jgi:hypothetical protein
MSVSEVEEPSVSDFEQSPEDVGELPYSIEIWDPPTGKTVRILARAAHASLAKAIFDTACEEHDRDIILKLGSRVIAERAARQRN